MSQNFIVIHARSVYFKTCLHCTLNSQEELGPYREIFNVFDSLDGAFSETNEYHLSTGGQTL